MDDRKIADTVNALRDTAIRFAGAQQLRERLGHIIVPHLSALKGAQLALLLAAYDLEVLSDGIHKCTDDDVRLYLSTVIAECKRAAGVGDV